MNRSRDRDPLLPEHSAPQHERGPRPLPLFLELVRTEAAHDADLARTALAGLNAYQSAERPSPLMSEPVVARIHGASLRDCGGEGPPAVLVPSLINPPHVLNLDREVSLAAAVASMGRRSFLLDWGPAAERRDLDVAAHVEQLLLPLLAEVDRPPALIGYCLGGTMAIAAANLAEVERVATLAAPWNFRAYPAAGRRSLGDLWAAARGPARELGALPMEVLQSAFWSLDPHRTVAKFADLALLERGSAAERRFVALEDWANEGEPLPYPAAREMIEDFFLGDRPGSGRWRVAGKTVGDALSVPVLHCTSSRDRITPAETVASGPEVRIDAGHVGMIVGSARSTLHRALGAFLDPACR